VAFGDRARTRRDRLSHHAARDVSGWRGTGVEVEGTERAKMTRGSHRLKLYAPAIAIALLSACSSHAASESAASVYDDASHPPPHPEVRVGKYGVGCLTFQDRTHFSNVSYSVDDMGKPGTPKLTSDEVGVVRRIQKYVHSKTLRFAFLKTEEPFVIFDATFGPCDDSAPGYWVMNDPSPDTFFEPGEAPAFEHPIPGEVAPTAGPWMRTVEGAKRAR
jgi:hypothetical protein